MNSKPNNFDNITIQKVAITNNIPTDLEIIDWLKAVLNHEKKTQAEINVRFVNTNEMQTLNKSYRSKDNITNVLSFRYEHIIKELPLAGDIVICPEFIEEQANKIGKKINAHYAHLIVHSCLHCLGYDHKKQNEAAIMETIEINILNTLGFTNPYGDKNENE